MTGLEIVILVIALAIMVVGLFGIVIPNLPGVILIWTGVFFYATLTKFERLDQDYILFITALCLFAILIDYAETIWGKKKIQHGLRGIVGAVLGGLIGSISGQISMMIVGTVLGAAFGLILSGRDPAFSVETSQYKVVLYVGSTIIKIAVGVTVIESFLVRIL